MRKLGLNPRRARVMILDNLMLTYSVEGTNPLSITIGGVLTNSVLSIYIWVKIT